MEHALYKAAKLVRKTTYVLFVKSAIVSRQMEPPAMPAILLSATVVLNPMSVLFVKSAIVSRQMEPPAMPAMPAILLSATVVLNPMSVLLVKSAIVSRQMEPPAIPAISLNAAAVLPTIFVVTAIQDTLLTSTVLLAINALFLS